MVNTVVAALAPGVTVDGANVQVASDGRPAQAKLTVWAKPPAGVTVSVVVPLEPAALIERLVGLAPKLNEGVTALTVMVTAEEVEAAKFVSPPYCAVMLWLPAASELVAYVATAELSVPVPSLVLPSRKVTVPVGVPLLPEPPATVAVKVTLVPAGTLVAEAFSVVVDEAGGVVTGAEP